MRWLNPFANLPTIMRAEEIIEYAHSRSKRLSMKSSRMIPKLERVRIREIARLQEFTRQVKIKIKEAVEEFPSLDHVHPFYFELTRILIGIDKLKQALGAVYNCIGPIDRITNNHIEAMKLSEDYRQIKRSRSAAKGRIASLLRATAKNFDTIIEAKTILSKLPGISPNTPTIVCAGFPNVGKSTFVRAVSTAEPEIAYYPFTTKNVIVGHLFVSDKRVQVVDTPGILDRPMSARNDIERAAIAALKYLAHVIIFMFDPSEACGWSMDDQVNLYHEVQRMFPLNPLFPVFNKVDITPPDRLDEARERIPDAIEVIALDGEGVENLIHLALDEIDFDDSEEESLTPVSSDES
ncbi:MAG: NOG1 family protein [Candidatus Thorarchaeota archaeon]